jgi:hypothetical protein
MKVVGGFLQHSRASVDKISEAKKGNQDGIANLTALNSGVMLQCISVDILCLQCDKLILTCHSISAASKFLKCSHTLILYREKKGSTFPFKGYKLVINRKKNS